MALAKAQGEPPKPKPMPPPLLLSSVAVREQGPALPSTLSRGAADRSASVPASSKPLELLAQLEKVKDEAKVKWEEDQSDRSLHAFHEAREAFVAYGSQLESR